MGGERFREDALRSTPQTTTREATEVSGSCVETTTCNMPLFRQSRAQVVAFDVGGKLSFSRTVHSDW